MPLPTAYRSFRTSASQPFARVVLVLLALLVLPKPRTSQAESPPGEAASAAGDLAAEAASPAPPQLPPPKDARQLSKTDQAWIHSDKGSVIVDGHVSLRRGILEMFACTKNTKEHESIVAVDSKAFVLHAALLAIGAKPGGTATFYPEYKAPHGTQIDIDVHWLNEKGEPQKMRAQDWIREAGSKKPMNLPWVFAGSGFWNDQESGRQGYLAEGGELICVSNFGEAMLDLPAEMSNQNESLLFEARTENIPPLGWPVRLVLKPVLKKDNTTSSLAESTSSISSTKNFNWPQWLGPQRNGLTEETGLLQEWPDQGPDQVWVSQKIGLGYAGPAIVDGVLYIMGTRDESSYLFALDANTGQERWASKIATMLQNGWGDGPRSTPTVDHDRVYAFAAGGTLVCCRTSNGEELWRVTMQDLGGKIPTWGYAESPLVDGERVLCTPGGKNGAIASLDKTTGKLKWQSSEITDGAHYSSIMKSSYGGAPQYIRLLSKRAIGVAASDGRLLWETPFPGRVAVIPTPIVRGNQIYLTAGYGAGCQLLELGKEGKSITPTYQKKFMKNQHGGVILLDDHLYGYSDGVGWLCQEWATGKKVWNNKKDLGKGAIGYADGRFYCLSEQSGEVVLIEATPEAWRERGRFTLSPQTDQRSPKGAIWVHPVIVNGKLYLRDQELLFCFDVKEK